MKCSLSRLPGLLPSGTLAILAGFTLGTLALVYAPERHLPTARSAPVEPSSDAATPDVAPADPEPFPAQERQQHLARLGIQRWHSAGFRGQGVKIAVLDSGFRGYRRHLGQALPAQIKVRSFRADSNLEARDSEHGILCSEVIHALAPEAELLFANWDPDSPDQFLKAVRWARAEGARVVSCSLIMPSWSDGEGGGRVNTELTTILGRGCQPGDLLCFASAGNTAQRHWWGSFQDDGAGRHLWSPGRTRNELTPWSRERVSVELYAQPGDDYEVQVLDVDGMAVGQTVRHPGSDRAVVIVHFLPERNESYRVQLRLLRGKGKPFHLVVLGGGLEYATARGSVACPADCPTVVAVGAVNHIGIRANYSSCGPNSQRPKPDFVAPVPFTSLWRPRPFSGTSAAAPQAASLAALCWSRHPDWSAEQVREALRESARDLGPRGHDWETGYGMIALPEEDLNLLLGN
jgi:subtilisin family serine protease